jgi:hypothetical protein
MMDWLKQIAPTIATALGGPLANMAVAAISKAIGVEPDQVQDVISTGKLSAEQISGIKLAELELQKQEKSLGLDFAKLSVEDTKSARDMQSTTRSLAPPMLAAAVTIGFFSILIMLMLGYAQKSDEMMIMLGSLGTAWTGIIGFYFGSSASSQNKDKLLYQSTPTK